MENGGSPAVLAGFPFFLAEGNRPLVSGFLISASFKGSLKDCS